METRKRQTQKVFTPKKVFAPLASQAKFQFFLRQINCVFLRTSERKQKIFFSNVSTSRKKSTTYARFLDDFCCSFSVGLLLLRLELSFQNERKYNLTWEEEAVLKTGKCAEILMIYTHHVPEEHKPAFEKHTLPLMDENTEVFSCCFVRFSHIWNFEISTPHFSFRTAFNFHVFQLFFVFLKNRSKLNM